MVGPKILHIDIETSPNEGGFWALFKQNIGISAIRKPRRILCFAARWDHQKRGIFKSEWQHGRGDMLAVLHQLLTEANAVCHYNGTSFDMKIIRGEFLKDSLPPIPRLPQIDLYREIKSLFAFPSHKLEYVAKILLGETKVKTPGMELWFGVIDGDPASQALMRRYNIQDTALLPKLLKRVGPWLPTRVNRLLWLPVSESMVLTCDFCLGTHIQRRGTHGTLTREYVRFVCLNPDCRRWGTATRCIKPSRPVSVGA